MSGWSFGQVLTLSLNLNTATQPAAGRFLPVQSPRSPILESFLFFDRTRGALWVSESALVPAAPSYDLPPVITVIYVCYAGRLEAYVCGRVEQGIS